MEDRIEGQRRSADGSRRNRSYSDAKSYKRERERENDNKAGCLHTQTGKSDKMALRSGNVTESDASSSRALKSDAALSAMHNLAETIS